MEEPYNSEGLKNHHKADGASFLSLRGNEYLNIWPVYDWQKIPGTTVLQKPDLPPSGEIQKDGLTTFVGAVTDGHYGTVGFDFISPHDLIKARKSWFFFDREYVCLGAGIESTSRFPVATTLNQCLLEGEVTIRDHRGERILEKGDHELHHLQWIYHNGVGYLLPEPSTVHLSNKKGTGSWWQISRQWDTSKDSVEKDVFKVWIDHGARPQGRRGGLVNEPMIARDVTYQYVVIPSVTLEQMSGKPDIEVLVNNRWIQGVKHKQLGLIQVIFFRAGTVQLTETMNLTLDSPGAVMIQMEGQAVKSITASDPSRRHDRLHLTLTGKLTGGQSEAHQIKFNQEDGETEISLEMPAGVEAGSSVSVNFRE
jgi:chondroitin AC lyase